MAHWAAEDHGPFTPAINQILSQGFGVSLAGLSVTRNDASKNDVLAAKAHTVGRRISLGERIREDSQDPESMEVIGHEVAHALGQAGPLRSMVDRPGDPGEHAAHQAGRSLRQYVEGGMQGPVPRLNPAHGGQACIQRWGYLDHPVITEMALHKAGVVGFSDIVERAFTGVNPFKVPRLAPRDTIGDYEYGSMWNDDLASPGAALMEFKLTHLDELLADHGAAFGPGADLIARSHYGDLSFLHGMASPRVRDADGNFDQFAGRDKDGNPLPTEAAQETQDKMIEWAKFTYAIKRGEIKTADGKAIKIDGNTKLSDYPSFKQIFGNDPQLGKKSIDELFGNQDGKRDIKRIAMGSLAHMVEDSFAPGHVERDQDGRIVEFHTYAGQDKHKHEDADRFPGKNSALGKQTVDETAAIMKLAHDPKAKWEDIEAHLRQDTFALAPNARNASPGEAFRRKPQPKATDKLAP